MPLDTGAVVGGKYRLVRQLGEGAMGTVWLAENTVLSSQVALKVLRAVHSPDARMRFEREARAVAGLESPHIVHVFDFGATDDAEPYLVMEYLPGVTLLEHIQERGSLPLLEVVDVVRQLCRALGVAHDSGIVHRDLKPANVFIVDVDGAPFVKVLDFGVAKIGTRDLDLTDTGALLGTPYYMSPEQLVNPKNIDHRADLWSVAVIAYAALAGELPFKGATVGALSIAVHQGDFAPPSTVRASLPESVDAFFTKALASEPAARHADARTFARAFADAAGQPAVTRITPSVRAGLEAAETEVGRSAVRDLPLEEAVGASTGAGTTATPTVVDAPPERPGKTPWWLVGLGAALVLVVALLALKTDEPPTPSAPTAVPTVAVRVKVVPADAAVVVDGEPAEVVDGVLLLGGAPGDAFVVTVRHRGSETTATVQITQNGVPNPSQLTVSVPPEATASAPPAAASTPPRVPLKTPRPGPTTTASTVDRPKARSEW